MSRSVSIRPGTERDASTIMRVISEWLNWEVPREESIRRAIKNRELLVADHDREVVGFIHSVMHEDIIDSGLNCFITAFYVAPKFRGSGVGSMLLDAAIRDALTRDAVGIETSTASPDARRLYQRHHFGQFMGKWTMGEVFLELDVGKYKETIKKSRERPKKNASSSR